MKSFFAIASLLVSVLAAPSPDPPEGAPVFNLVTKSNNPQTNGLVLTIRQPGTTNAAYPLLAVQKGPGAKFWTDEYVLKEPGLPDIRSFNFRAVAPDHTITLRGPNGLLTLQDTIAPWEAGNQLRSNEKQAWGSFIIDGSGSVSIKDRTDIPTRQWVAIRATGGYTIALWDGYTPFEGKTANKVELLATAQQ